MSQNEHQKTELALDELHNGQVVIEASLEEALDHFKKAEMLDPMSSAVLMELADTFRRLENYPEAVSRYERLLKLNPSSIRARAFLAFCHRASGHYDLAMAKAEDVIRADPENVIALEVKVDCLGFQKKFQDALGILEVLNTRENVIVTKKISRRMSARLSAKESRCHLELGSHKRALEIASTLIENGYETKAIFEVYGAAQIKVREEIQDHLKSLSFIERLFSHFQDRAFMRIFLSATRDMETLTHDRNRAIDEAQRHRALAEAHAKSAYTDALTGLSNSHAFREKGILEINLRGACAIVAVDIDKFKSVNDVHGHGGGNQVLKKFADLAMEFFVAPSATVYRTGGEEFLVIVLDDLESVPELAEKFRLALEKRAAQELAVEGLVLRWESGEKRELTASIGVAYWPKDGGVLDKAIELADIACYDSKNCGRNRVTVWMDKRIEKNMPNMMNQEIETQGGNKPSFLSIRDREFVPPAHEAPKAVSEKKRDQSLLEGSPPGNSTYQSLDASHPGTNIEV